MDFFAGSGTLGESAYNLGRKSILVDSNPDAIAVMKRRFAGYDVEWIGCEAVNPAPSPKRKCPNPGEDREMLLFKLKGA